MERELSDVIARVRTLEDVSGRHDGEIRQLKLDYNNLNLVAATAIATAELKWNMLFKVVAIVGAVAAIIGGMIEFALRSASS